MDWRYVNGRLEPAEIPWPEWAKPADQREATVALGYDEYPSLVLGMTNAAENVTGGTLGAEVFVKDKPEASSLPDESLVEVSIGAYVEVVLAPDFPALLQFLNTLVPLAQLAIATEDQERLNAHLVLHKRRYDAECVHCRREAPKPPKAAVKSAMTRGQRRS